MVLAFFFVAIVRLLAASHDNVMAVGDDAQSIYAFRGASFRNIMDFPSLFPGTKVITLEENYRSTQPILDVANAIIAQARILGDYPYALARADELAFISGREREAFSEMVTTALMRAGVPPALSPKAYYKTLTRQGRRKYQA